MSALFDDSYLKTLTATIGSAPAPSANKLLVAWAKKDSAYAEGNPAYAVQLARSSGASPTSYVRLQTLTSTNAQAQASYGTDNAAGASSGFTSDTWRLLAMYVPGDDGVTNVYGRLYNNSSSSSATNTAITATGNAGDFQYLTVGNGHAIGSFNNWRGRIAEIAIFSPADLTEANAIVAELLTTRADAITTKAPIWYAPLESDATLAVGTGAITNNNSVTFSDADHPSLSGRSTAPTLTSPTGTATGTTTATVGATTDTATGTLYGYVSTSATPPSAADLKAGTGAVWSGSVAVSSTGAKTLSATGLTAATGYYAHLIHTDGSANDSNIVTSAQFTTNALTKKLKLLAHADAQGDSGVAGVVFDAPTGSNITGPNKIGEFTGKTFEASLEGGKAVLKVPVADFGGSALTTSDTPVALVRNATNTTGIISCTVIEE